MGDKISIIVPTHNRSALLQETLRCIFAQTWADKEVVVIDEASSDDTLQMLGRKYPSVKVVHHDVPRGLCGARNAGIAASTGVWLVYLDDDDLIHPRHLEELHRASLAAPPTSIVAGPTRDFAVIDGEVRFGPVLQPPSDRSDVATLNELLNSSGPRPLMFSTVLWPRSVFDKMKWDEQLAYYEDFDLFGRTILSGRHFVGRQAGMHYARIHSGPRITTGRNANRLIAPLRYRLKWSDLLLPRPDRDAYAPTMRNGLMALLNEWSGVPAAEEYIPRLLAAFRAWGGRRFYITSPPQSAPKRVLLQLALDLGGPAMLRRCLGLLGRLRSGGGGISYELSVSNYNPATSDADRADQAFIKSCQETS
jgi:glycosyltransferase involved in cell wall biosynthesis